MTQEIINTLEMLVNENDPDMRTYYAVAINNYILELEKQILSNQSPRILSDDEVALMLNNENYQVKFKQEPQEQ